MADILPFCGYRYNSELIEDWSQVFVPPYDVINAQKLHRYQALSPYNMVHLTLSDPQLRGQSYEHIRHRLDEWQKKNILIEDKEASIYFYSMEFNADSDSLVAENRLKQKHILSGFMALVKLEDFSSNKIYPHEITFPGPRADRLQLLESTQTHFEPLYALYDDAHRKIHQILHKNIPQNKAQIELKDEEGTLHRFWRVTQERIIHQVQSEMMNKILYIADGHHRYEAALEYRNKIMRKIKSGTAEHPANYILMYLVNLHEPDLFIFPTHRLLRNMPILQPPLLHKKLEEYFIMKPFSLSSGINAKNELIKILSQNSENNHQFGFYDGKYYLLQFKNIPQPKSILDVELFQDYIMGKIFELNKKESILHHLGFTHSLNDAIEKINSAEYQYAFILRAPSIQDIKIKAMNRICVPQKSTYFYPKPFSGFVLYLFNR